MPRLTPNPRRFRQWCRRARLLWPLDKPVRINRIRGLSCREPDGTRSRLCGECWDAGTHYVIRLDAGMCSSATHDTLLHEWAHLLLGEVDRADPGEHGPEFWAKVGECWRSWHRER